MQGTQGKCLNPHPLSEEGIIYNVWEMKRLTCPKLKGKEDFM